MKNILPHPINAFGILKVSMSGIRVENLEERINPKVPFPHKHDFYQLLFITKGAGQHQVDFTLHRIVKNQIFIVKPGQVHSWKLGKSVKGLVVEFNRESLPLELIQELQNSKDSFISKKSQSFERMLHIVQVMQQEFREQKNHYDLSLRGLLIGLIAQVIRKASEEKIKVKTISNVEKFRNLLEEHFKAEHRVEFYAKSIAVSPKSLTMQIFRSLGKSPRDLIQDRVLLEAKRLLAFSSSSVSEIGLALGFEDANYFSRFFRKQQGQSPLEFRKSSSNF